MADMKEPMQDERKAKADKIKSLVYKYGEICTEMEISSEDAICDLFEAIDDLAALPQPKACMVTIRSREEPQEEQDTELPGAPMDYNFHLPGEKVRPLDDDDEIGVMDDDTA